MLVSLYMTRDPLTVGPEEDVAAASRTMNRHRVRCLPVVDDGRLCGVLSRTDLLRVLPERDRPFSAEGAARATLGVRVEEAMTTAVVTVGPDDSIDEAVAQLERHKLSVLVVVRGARVVGILSRSDILRAFREIVFAPSAVRVSLLAPAGRDLIGVLLAHARVGELRLRAYAEHAHGDDRLVELAVEGAGDAVEQALGALVQDGVRLLTRRNPHGS